MKDEMLDTRLQYITTALDDARTWAQELLDEIDSTSPFALPMKRVLRHCGHDIRDLDNLKGYGGIA